MRFLNLTSQDDRENPSIGPLVFESLKKVGRGGKRKCEPWRGMMTNWASALASRSQADRYISSVSAASRGIARLARQPVLTSVNCDVDLRLCSGSLKQVFFPLPPLTSFASEWSKRSCSNITIYGVINLADTANQSKDYSGPRPIKNCCHVIVPPW